ncbi:MAG: putative oxidoreductase, partial [Marinimicrobia bacterium 46_43]
MDLGLKGKVALLTGASRGLGYAAAEALAKEGVDIAINSRDEKTLFKAGDKLAKYGTRVVSLPGDVADPKQAEMLVMGTIATLGKLDLLFTNAGGPPPGAFESFT